MKKMKKETSGRSGGFTLIELMIVVAIIGILAAVAIPKFADLIRKSKEGSTKGTLGALKSAMTIYYGEAEGSYPSTVGAALGADLTDAAWSAANGKVFHVDGPFLTKYLESVPTVKLGLPGTTHGDTAVIYRQQLASPAQTTANASDETTNGGAWRYNSSTGAVWVGCTHTDTKGSTIGSW